MIRIQRYMWMFLLLCVHSLLFFAPPAHAGLNSDCQVRTAKAGGPIKVGDCAFDLAPLAAANDLTKLPSFKDKVVLLHFWATWCEPCLTEIPTLAALTQKLSGKPVVVVAVSLDESQRQIDKFFAKQGTPPFFNLIDKKQELSARYGTFKVPETYIIAPDGRVTDKVIGSRHWEDTITQHYLETLAQRCNSKP